MPGGHLGGEVGKLGLDWGRLKAAAGGVTVRLAGFLEHIAGAFPAMGDAWARNDSAAKRQNVLT